MSKLTEREAGRPEAEDGPYFRSGKTPPVPNPEGTDGNIAGLSELAEREQPPPLIIQREETGAAASPVNPGQYVLSESPKKKRKPKKFPRGTTDRFRAEDEPYN